MMLGRSGTMGGRLVCAIVAILTLIFCGACKERTEVFTIGVAANPQRDAPALNGLRQGLADFGYEEGKTLKYIYENIIVEDGKLINTQLEALLKQDIDILFVVGAAGGYAKELIKGTDMPVLFCGDPDPVGHEIIESLSHPGGNITGVKAVNGVAKTMEWLTIIKPGLKKVWMPYDPDDPFSSLDVSAAKNASIHLGIEIALHEVHSAKETVEAIENLSEELDAVFVNPSRVLLPGVGEIIQAATDQGLPTASSVKSVDTILLVLSTDYFDAGRKTARLAHLLFRGEKPSELPVETPETFMTVNLKTAEKICLTIPNEVLMVANEVIR